MLLELVLGITAVNLLFSVWMLRIFSIQLQQAVVDLDTKLAAAISGLVEKGLGDFEPINPIQAAIANMLTANLQRNTTAGEVIDVVRDNTGKSMGGNNSANFSSPIYFVNGSGVPIGSVTPNDPAVDTGTYSPCKAVIALNTRAVFRTDA